MRINVVPPSELTRLHLIAEVREIKMLPKMLCRSLLSAKGVTGIPGEYTLNKGHGKFFYDKLGFISNRFAELVHECIERGYALQEDTTRLWGLITAAVERGFAGFFVHTQGGANRIRGRNVASIHHVKNGSALTHYGCPPQCPGGSDEGEDEVRRRMCR